MQGIPMSSAIAALIINRALCLECIAKSTAMRPEEVDTAIAMLSRGLKIDRYANGTCSNCREDGLVFAIDRP